MPPNEYLWERDLSLSAASSTPPQHQVVLHEAPYHRCLNETIHTTSFYIRSCPLNTYTRLGYYLQTSRGWIKWLPTCLRQLGFSCWKAEIHNSNITGCPYSFCIVFFKLTLICFYYLSYNTLLSHLHDGQIKVRKNGLKVFLEKNKQIIIVEEN